AKGSGGIYGGVLSAVLISAAGFPFTIGLSAVMAIVAGLLVIPLKSRPPVWRETAGTIPGQSPSS
ncbi:MAG: hypothetical protein WCC75_09870, partial [Desulfobaccales bacterium]